MDLQAQNTALPQHCCLCFRSSGGSMPRRLARHKLCEPWALLCPWHWGLLAPAIPMPCCCMPFWSLPKSTSPCFAVPTQIWTHWKAQHTHFPFSFPVLSQTRKSWCSKQEGVYQNLSKPWLLSFWTAWHQRFQRSSCPVPSLGQDGSLVSYTREHQKQQDF